MPLIPVQTVLPATGMLSSERPVMVSSLFYRGRTYGYVNSQREEFEPPKYINALHGHAEPIPPHNHELYEIAIVCGGSALHITDHYEKPIGPGSVIVVPPMVVHAFEEVNDFVVINICYLTEWVSEAISALWEDPILVQLFLANDLFETSLLNVVPQLDLPKTQFKQCLSELNALAHELESPTPSRLYLRLCLMKVLVLLSRCYKNTLSDEAAHPGFRQEVWHVLEAVEECISRGEPLELAEMAKACALSQDYLTHLFRSETGLSIRDYFQKRRAQRAANLLLKPDNSVTDVAYELHYADTSHLSRMFQRYYQQTPKQFQKRYVINRRKPTKR